MKFPELRLRRFRRTASLRRLVAETRPDPSRFILPIFVDATIKTPKPIDSMPGNLRHTVDSASELAAKAEAAGLGGVILFGIPQAKDATGTQAYAEDGPVPLAIKKIKQQTPELVIVADVCLCEYTDHGHCGPLCNGEVDNDAALPLLARTAATYAMAGADIVAPSDMMDGRVAAIRQALDDNDCSHTPILSYAAKTASGFYGPFRDAADSTPAFGDRRGYQMDPANAREALREIELDIAEGADAIMVKPALPMLDIIRGASERFEYPLFAYQVSGEFSMIKAAAERGWLDEQRTFGESLLSILRAGADSVITYWALEAAQFFK